jgi:hypothetical protein
MYLFSLPPKFDNAKRRGWETGQKLLNVTSVYLVFKWNRAPLPASHLSAERGLATIFFVLFFLYVIHSISRKMGGLLVLPCLFGVLYKLVTKRMFLFNFFFCGVHKHAQLLTKRPPSPHFSSSTSVAPHSFLALVGKRYYAIIFLPLQNGSPQPMTRKRVQSLPCSNCKNTRVTLMLLP